MKKIKIIIAVIVGIVVLAAIILSMSINRIVVSGVEAALPKFTGCPVTLESASISLFSGKGSLNGFVLGNPEGFNTEYALKFDEVSIDIDVMSLLSDTIVINEILIAGPQVIYELGLKGSNIGAITDVAMAGGKETEEDEKEDTGAGKSVIIKKFTMRDGTISLSATILMGGKATVPMPTIELEDIGKDGSSGADPAEVFAMIFDEMSGIIVKAVKESGKLLGNVGDELKDAGGDIKDGVKGVFEGLKVKFGGEK